MNQKCSIFGFIEILLLLLLLVPLRSTSADEQFVADICKRTESEDQCKWVLLSDPRSLQATTIDALSLIAFDVAIDTAILSNRQADDLARQYRGTPPNAPLSQCAQIYLDLETQLQTAKSLAQSSSFNKANDVAVDARTKPDSCETQFANKNLASPLLPTDEDLTKKCAVCASLTQLLIG